MFLGQRGTTESAEVGALHEAAHALVGHFLGWRIDWVKLYGLRESGRTGYDGGSMMLPPLRTTLAHRSAVRLAGEVAEGMCTGRSALQIREDSQDDWEQLLAVDFVRSHLGRREKARIVRSGRCLARRLIRINMNALMRLAAAVHKGPVTARAVQDLIGKTGDDGKKSTDEGAWI